MNSKVQCSISNGVAKIVIDNGPNNLLTTEFWQLLNGHVIEAGKDPNIRVLTIHGTPGVFVAGADLKEIGKLGALGFREFGKLTLDTIQRIRELPKPVIAAVDGLALGAGCGVVFASDLVVATERSSFGLPEIHLGIFGGMGLAPWVLGKARASELMLLGERISAVEALNFGIVNKVVPVENLQDCVDTIVSKLIAKSSLGLQLAKESIAMSLEVGPLHAGRYHFDLCALMTSSEDWAEGVTAFFEKRSAQFKGR